MKKKNLGKSIFIIAYTLLLCVTVSFAWILAIKPNIVQNVNINYNDDNKLIIAPSDIEGAVYVVNEKGEEVELTSDFHIDPKDVLPNSIIDFKIRLKNNTDNLTKIDVSLVGITTSRETLLNVVYFSATPSTGWGKDAPHSEYKQLGDAKKSQTSETYSLTVLNEISLRSTDKENEEDYLEFSCYFFFDPETMTNEHQNTELVIGAFRITQK